MIPQGIPIFGKNDTRHHTSAPNKNKEQNGKGCKTAYKQRNLTGCFVDADS